MASECGLVYLLGCWLNKGSRETFVNPGYALVYYAPDYREGGNKRCFCPCVCLSVHRVHSEPKGLSCLNLEGRFPTFDATRSLVSRSNGQRSGLEASGGIPCRPNLRPHCLLHLFASAAAHMFKHLMSVNV